MSETEVYSWTENVLIVEVSGTQFIFVMLTNDKFYFFRNEEYILYIESYIYLLVHVLCFISSMISLAIASNKIGALNGIITYNWFAENCCWIILLFLLPLLFLSGFKIFPTKLTAGQRHWWLYPYPRRPAILFEYQISKIAFLLKFLGKLSLGLS